MCLRARSKKPARHAMWRMSAQGKIRLGTCEVGLGARCSSLFFVLIRHDLREAHRLWREHLRETGKDGHACLNEVGSQRGEYVVTEPNNRQILCTTCISAIFLSLGSHGDAQCSMTGVSRDFLHDDAILRTSTLFYRNGKLLVEVALQFFCRHKST